MNALKHLTIGTIVAVIVTSSLQAQDQDDDQPPKRRPAEIVFQRLLEQYQGGEADGLATLELLRTWSLRDALEPVGELSFTIPPTEEARAEIKQTVATAIESHRKRMEGLGKLVRARYAVGTTSYTEVAAVDYYMKEAERLPRTFVAKQLIIAFGGEAKETFPMRERSESAIPGKQIEVVLDTKTRISVGGKELTREQFDKLLREEKAKHGELSVSFRCDPKARSRDVVAVIDIASEYAQRVRISETEQPDEQQDK